MVTNFLLTLQGESLIAYPEKEKLFHHTCD